ncbi:acyl carrier protein [Methylobacterium aquaticum]|uniref:acyl carrier protein n=1 Tax=Methylobacterium aquaticum TaxID=270351 RepID=UPI003D16D1D6
MSADTIARRVAVLISREFRVDLDRVTPETKLEALGADNIDVVNLALDIEDEFRFRLTADEMQALDVGTVADVIQIAEASLQQAAA